MSTAVATVTIKLEKPVKKKDVRAWIEQTLTAQAGREGWLGITKIRVRDVDLD